MTTQQASELFDSNCSTYHEAINLKAMSRDKFIEVVSGHTSQEIYLFDFAKFIRDKVYEGYNTNDKLLVLSKEYFKQNKS